MAALRYSLMGLTAETFETTREGRRQGLLDMVRSIELAEAGGLDGAFVSEHHFVPESHIAPPLMGLAAAAGTTERIILGTNIALAPLYNPVRFAEDAATVDLLSGGRLVLGLGLGYRPEEFDGLGADKRDRVRLLHEVVARLKEGGTGGISPAPWQEPGVRVWIGAFAEAGVRRARQIADGYLAPTISVRAVQKRVGWLAEEGDLDGFEVAVSLNGFVGAGDAWATSCDAILFIERRYKRWQVESADLANAQSLSDTYDTLDRPPHLIVGNPDECVEQLRPWVEALSQLPGGARGHIQLRVNYPGLPTTACEEAIRLFAHEVVPRLRALETA